MDRLRGKQSAIHVTAFFVLAFAMATTLTLFTPRATHAEGPLLSTVRCLVRTVLVTNCRTPEATAQTPASSQAPPTQSAPEASTQSAPSSSTSKSAQPERSFEPIAPIDTTLQAVPEVQGSLVGSQQRIPESEYVSYFNAYSPYAVQGAQATTNGAVETSSEGWRIAGIAWYWWLAVVIIFGTLFLVGKRILLRGYSGLSQAD